MNIFWAGLFAIWMLLTVSLLWVTFTPAFYQTLDQFNSTMSPQLSGQAYSTLHLIVTIAKLSWRWLIALGAIGTVIWLLLWAHRQEVITGGL